MRTLTYKTYLDLLTALDEHSNCMMTKRSLQKAIFKHYIALGPFKITNAIGDQMVFKPRQEVSIEARKAIRGDMKMFIYHMDTRPKGTAHYGLPPRTNDV